MTMPTTGLQVCCVFVSSFLSSGIFGGFFGLIPAVMLLTMVILALMILTLTMLATTLRTLATTLLPACYGHTYSSTLTILLSAHSPGAYLEGRRSTETLLAVCSAALIYAGGVVARPSSK